MPDTSTNNTKKSMEQPNNVPEAMEQILMDSDEFSEPPKNLCDMPDDIVALIIQRSDYKEQLVLRKTSKTLRELVDKQKPACTSLSITNELNGIVCTNYVRNGGRIEFNDFGFTLKNPKLELEVFRVYHNIHKIMESINHQVPVKKLDLTASNPSCFLSILPYLKPGVLKKIAICARDFEWSAPAMRQVVQLQQWIECEEMRLYWSLKCFPMEYATHFKRFDIFEASITRTNFVWIRDYLSRIPNFEKCALICVDLFHKRERIRPLMGTLIDSNGRNMTFHYPIPNTDYYLDMRFSDNVVLMDIEKKKNPN